MKRRLFLASVLCACVALTSCERQQPVHEVGFLAMGTSVEISIADADVTRAAPALAETEELMQRLGREWYPWTPDGSGELAQLNQAIGNGRSMQVSPELASLLAASQKFAQLSDGALDPGVGKLVELWGFQTGERSASQAAPTQDQLAAWRAHPASIAQLMIDADGLRSSNHDLKIDLGALAKGRVVDMATAILRNHGFVDFIVNAGGKLRAVGSAGGRAWRVAIRHPRSERIVGWIEIIGDESVSTSGDYERFFEVAGQRFHHLLDPATGMPVAHTRAVTVVATDATLADAASTALFIAGPDNWPKVARALGVTQVLRIDSQGRIEVSAAMQRRIKFTTGDDRSTVARVVDL